MLPHLSKTAAAAGGRDDRYPPRRVRRSGDGKVVRFLDEIGLPMRCERIERPTRLPGITIDRGTLRVDRYRLLYPGDLLHEGGHLAVLPANERTQFVGDASSDPRPRDDGHGLVLCRAPASRA